MKGKKYSAAEKHFNKLRDRDNRIYKATLSDNAVLRERLKLLEEENSVLKKQAEIYRNLLGADADSIVKQYEQTNQILKLIGSQFISLHLS